MVVGEPQVLGQVRRAYSIALEAGTAGRILNRLVHHAFRVAKRVRTETGIGANAVSISYMAVELGKKIFNSLEGRTALLLGAGEMAELSARHLLNAGVSRVLLANRTEERAERLATELGGETINFDALSDYLAEADIIICSTAAEHYVITEQMAREALEQTTEPAVFLYRHQRSAQYRSGGRQDSQRFCFRYRRPGVSDLVEHSRARARGGARGVDS